MVQLHVEIGIQFVDLPGNLTMTLLTYKGSRKCIMCGSCSHNTDTLVAALNFKDKIQKGLCPNAHKSKIHPYLINISLDMLFYKDVI